MQMTAEHDSLRFGKSSAETQLHLILEEVAQIRLQNKLLKRRLKERQQQLTLALQKAAEQQVIAQDDDDDVLPPFSTSGDEDGESDWGRSSRPSTPFIINYAADEGGDAERERISSADTSNATDGDRVDRLVPSRPHSARPQTSFRPSAAVQGAKSESGLQDVEAVSMSISAAVSSAMSVNTAASASASSRRVSWSDLAYAYLLYLFSLTHDKDAARSQDVGVAAMEQFSSCRVALAKGAHARHDQRHAPAHGYAVVLKVL